MDPSIFLLLPLRIGLLFAGALPVDFGFVNTIDVFGECARPEIGLGLGGAGGINSSSSANTEDEYAYVFACGFRLGLDFGFGFGFAFAIGFGFIAIAIKDVDGIDVEFIGEMVGRGECDLELAGGINSSECENIDLGTCVFALF